MATANVPQKNMAANRARSLIFVEGDDICFNYKTGQWTSVSAYDGFSLFSINSKTASIGINRFSGTAVSLQTQFTNRVAQTAILETGEIDLNQYGRAYIDAVRPLVNGGTPTVRVGVRDAISDAVVYSTGTAVNSRTGQANFRSAANYPEGKYVRVEVTIPDDFTTALGADIDVKPSGTV